MNIYKYKNTDPSYSLPDSGDYLTDFKKINIFVGPNNSGKSRFMRQIYNTEAENLFFQAELREKISNLIKKLETLPRLNPYTQDLSRLLNTRSVSFVDELNKLVDKIDKEVASGNDVAATVKHFFVSEKLFETISDSKNPLRIYVPILRGLRHPDTTPSTGKNDLYFERTIRDYGLERGQIDRTIFTGLKFHEASISLLLGNRTERDAIHAFEVFLKEKFFNSEITITPDHATDLIRIHIDGSKDDRSIHDLGDGIQSIIIILFKIFENRNRDTIIFVEEPEMTLHPAMQRILIEALTDKEYFPKLQVFLTTHSNHFLDLTYDYPKDIAIFSFEKIPTAHPPDPTERETFTIKTITDNVKVLDLLGIRNSSVFLSNSVIWTEGVTDRMLIKELMRLSGNFNGFIEDKHYTFAEYGGSNLNNFDFISTNEKDVKTDAVNISAISRKNFLIADNDNKKKGAKAEQRKRLKSVFKENFFDEHIEIENLIPFSIWNTLCRKHLTERHEIQVKNNPKETENTFNSCLKKTKINILLKKHLIEPKSDENIPKYFDENSIACLGLPKKEIMTRVLEIIERDKIDLTAFPQTAKDLIEKIKDFIQKANE